MEFIVIFSVAIAVSRDHKPDQSDERQRIEDAGGFVMWAGKNTSRPLCKLLSMMVLTQR